ncbi:heme exporter protein CcmD [Rehaibacterium terrae]|jgi:heme exporter protein D|uniref:Heme exporter protein D n=1 Tax=Rehaibacterium terrae TaxID=1341696 RepID=A0A7W7XX36_9GAMM|nr:heme exporter protein CcmD [Rehaibacterium terrae]MBB5014333.1 heme exporter protein CcmD [Rehaibacterium terrae]
MSTLLEMSYAPYVWSAFAVFIVALAWDGLSPWFRHRRVRRDIVLRARREAARTGKRVEVE